MDFQGRFMKAIANYKYGAFTVGKPCENSKWSLVEKLNLNTKNDSPQFAFARHVPLRSADIRA